MEKKPEKSSELSKSEIQPKTEIPQKTEIPKLEITKNSRSSNYGRKTSVNGSGNTDKSTPTTSENSGKQKSVADRLNEYETILGMWNSKIFEIDRSQLEKMNKKHNCYLRLIDIQNDKKQIESTQIQLSECDQFAEAEQLDIKLECLREETKSLYDQIRQVSREWITLEDEKSAVYGKLTTLRREGIKKLKFLEVEQEEVMEDIMRKIKQENEDMEYNIGAKMQRIERDLDHIKADLASLSDKQQRILVIVRERTSTQCSEKDIWTEKYTKLQSEIGGLLARLEILRAEESLCQEKISAIDSEISSASERYQSELKVIEVDKNKCSQEQSELLSKET